MMTTDDHLYRRGVGVMLINRDGRVWVGRRIDNSDEAWQMPQGGMDPGETPWDTALRELEEETGILLHLVEWVADHPQRQRYDLPPDLAKRLWKGKWKGRFPRLLSRRAYFSATPSLGLQCALLASLCGGQGSKG